MKIYNKTKANKVRHSVLNARTKRNESRDVEKFTIDSDLIADPTDGTLVYTAVQNDLPVSITNMWGNPAPVGELDTVTVQVSHDGGATFTDVFRRGADANSTFPMPFTIPKTYLAPDGPLILRYKLELLLGSTDFSDNLDLIVDTTPPWGKLRYDAQDTLSSLAGSLEDEQRFYIDGALSQSKTAAGISTSWMYARGNLVAVIARVIILAGHEKCCPSSPELTGVSNMRRRGGVLRPETSREPLHNRAPIPSEPRTSINSTAESVMSNRRESRPQILLPADINTPQPQLTMQ